jgi:hypothetical protein
MAVDYLFPGHPGRSSAEADATPPRIGRQSVKYQINCELPIAAKPRESIALNYAVPQCNRKYAELYRWESGVNRKRPTRSVGVCSGGRNVGIVELAHEMCQN